MGLGSDPRLVPVSHVTGNIFEVDVELQAVTTVVQVHVHDQM